MIGSRPLRRKGRLTLSIYLFFFYPSHLYSWLYTLILVIDAGFRMKNKDRNTNINPALGDGWGHFVPEEPFQEHIKKFGDKEEVRFSLIP